MKLPIVQYPRIVAENLAHFAPVFETPEQRKHFCEYVTGLIAGDKATIAAINGLFLNNNDQSALNKFMSQAQWPEEELNYRRVLYELTRLHRRPVSTSAGRLILDDTLAHHTKCSMEGLAYLRDHSIGRNVWAHNVVTSYYVNRSDQFPVDFRLYHQFSRKYEKRRLHQVQERLRNGATLANYRQYIATLVSQHYRHQLHQPKTRLGTDLVQQAIAWELPFSVVLFDSWFLRWPLVEAIEAVGKDWIGACPKDRLILHKNCWTQLQSYIQTIPAEAYRPYQLGDRCYWVFSKVLTMKNLNRQRVRVVASYENHVKSDKLPRFYATNRKEWEAKRILTTYLDRWPTETFNEDAKGTWALKIISYVSYELSNAIGISPS
ncbi:MAG: transposase [Anaerolineales bacterium]|nr:transposase [Anaerolineales bacterium]